MVKLFAVPSDPFCCSLAECNLGDEISPAAYSYLKINKRDMLNYKLSLKDYFSQQRAMRCLIRLPTTYSEEE